MNFFNELQFDYLKEKFAKFLKSPLTVIGLVLSLSLLIYYMISLSYAYQNKTSESLRIERENIVEIYSNIGKASNDNLFSKFYLLFSHLSGAFKLEDSVFKKFYTDVSKDKNLFYLLDLSQKFITEDSFGYFNYRDQPWFDAANFFRSISENKVNENVSVDNLNEADRNVLICLAGKRVTVMNPLGDQND
ncbi:MAG: hypothetical protein H6845_00950 [Alphaproteobacteria bacterium]|nr:MAG: hypothetical protein H6845_00950 [Alphaproteobacteria bacterium]